VENPAQYMLLRWIRRPIKEGTQTRGMAGILSFFPTEVMLYSPQMRPIATAVARSVVGMLFAGHSRERYQTAKPM